MPIEMECLIDNQACSQGIACGCNVPTTNLNALTRNLQNIKENMLICPLKKSVTPYCIHVLPVLYLQGWEQLIFKNVHIPVYSIGFVQSFRAHYVIEVLILWPRQRCFLRFCIYSIYTCYIYDRALYTYINFCVYIHPLRKPLHPTRS